MVWPMRWNDNLPTSSQPWRAFRPDGVIFFSDILTPLPALGIEFDVIKGKGPQISNPVRRCREGRGGGERESLQFRDLLGDT